MFNFARLFCLSTCLIIQSTKTNSYEKFTILIFVVFSYFFLYSRPRPLLFEVLVFAVLIIRGVKNRENE
jgi:hypothetical protein